MKIHFTKKEYRKLIDMLVISEWVMNAHKHEEDSRCKPYKDIEQKVLSYSKQFGCDDIIEYSKSLDSFFPNGEYEEDEPSQEFIDEFVEETFWDALCNRLAKRDLVEEKGLNYIESLDPIERMTAIDEYEERYRKDFHENGLKNLKI